MLIFYFQSLSKRILHNKTMKGKQELTSKTQAKTPNLSYQSTSQLLHNRQLIHISLKYQPKKKIRSTKKLLLPDFKKVFDHFI